MCAHLSNMAALPLIIGATLGNIALAAGDPVLSSERLADSYVRDEITQVAPEAVAETYFLPLARTCPRTPAGRSRWDLCR